jgi:hypothetical protein
MLMSVADHVRIVFTDMIKVGNTGGFARIELHDEELETGSVLHELFDIMIKNLNLLDLSVKPTHSPTRRQLVIKLAQKYECRREIHAIHQDLRLGLYVNKRNPWSVFELAVRLDDHDLCLDAVKRSATWVSDDQTDVRSQGEFGEPISGGGLFDIRCYSLEMMKALPIEVIWALARASHSYVKMGAEPLKKAHNELAARYYQLMGLKGEVSLSNIAD